MSVSPEATGVNKHNQLQSGTAAKDQTSVSITFKRPFTAPPAVVVTPYWPGSANGVHDPETVTAVSETGFTVTSVNKASGYQISWMAYVTS